MLRSSDTRVLRVRRTAALHTSLMRPSRLRQGWLHDSRHRRKVVCPGLGGSVVVHRCILCVCIGSSRVGIGCVSLRPSTVLIPLLSWTEPGCSTTPLPRSRHINYQCIIHSLTTGKESIHHSTHLLLWPQYPLLSLHSWLLRTREHPQRHVWRIEGPTKRIRVLPQNHVPYIIDKIVIFDLDQCGAGARPPDPYLPHHSAGKIG